MRNISKHCQSKYDLNSRTSWIRFRGFSWISFMISFEWFCISHSKKFGVKREQYMVTLSANFRLPGWWIVLPLCYISYTLYTFSFVSVFFKFIHFSLCTQTIWRVSIYHCYILLYLKFHFALNLYNFLAFAIQTLWRALRWVVVANIYTHFNQRVLLSKDSAQFAFKESFSVIAS